MQEKLNQKKERKKSMTFVRWSRKCGLLESNEFAI